MARVIGHRTLLLPLLICALLGAAAAPAAAAGPAKPLPVRVLLAGGPHPLPLRGARVTVLRGGRVVGRARTGSRGVALVMAPPRRAALLVRAHGGRVGRHRFAGHMTALVSRYRWPRTLHVNSVTTLAARFAHANRDLTRRRVARRLRRFLELPPGFRPGLDGRTDAGFDGRRLLRAARRHGYDATLDHLARRMANPRARRPFPPRRGGQRAAHRAAVLETPVGTIGDLGEAVSSASDFFEKLEKVDYVLDFADAVLDISGLGDDGASAQQLEEVSAQLQEVEEGVTLLRGEVQGLKEEFSNSAYAEKAGRATATFEAIGAFEDTVQTVVQIGEQANCPAAAEAPACRRAASLLRAAEAEYAKEGPTTVAQLRTYAAAIAGNATPEGGGLGEGLLQAGSVLTTNGTHRVFYTAADSRRLAYIAGYWLSSYGEAVVFASLAAERARKTSEVREHEAELMIPFTEALQRATPRQLPSGVVIDMVHGTMWPTEASATGTSHPWSWFVENGPWRYQQTWRTGTWLSATGASVPANGSPGSASNPYSDWLVAGLGHVNPLLEAVTPRSGQTAGAAVLEQAGIDPDVITPPYGGHRGEPEVAPGRGLEMEEHREGSLYTVEEGIAANSGCAGEASTCFWPIWVGDDTTIGNFNFVSPAYHYVVGGFTTDNPFDGGEPRWGDDEEGSIYGNDPIENIPNLFFRQITPSECYYYPLDGAPVVGSPGCPG